MFQYRFEIGLNQVGVHEKKKRLHSWWRYGNVEQTANDAWLEKLKFTAKSLTFFDMYYSGGALGQSRVDKSSPST